MNKIFDYDSLPFDTIATQYRHGASWRSLAKEYGCPDHKTLAQHVMKRFPELKVRNHAEAQRARRAREDTSRRRSREDKATPRPRWWG